MSDAIERTAQPRAPMLLLVGLMAASQLAITIHLAALPALPGILDTSQAMVQHTITLYLFAFAVAQLIVGPLSDTLGRRPMVIAGMALFSLASIGAALAPTIELLIAARIVQAVGACAGIVLSRAIVRDCYTGKRSISAMAYLAISMALMPAMAPLIGGELFVRFGWQSVFVATAVAGAAVMLASIFALAETLPKELRRPLHLWVLLRGYATLLGQRRYMTYTGSVSFLTASFNGFLAAIPIILIVVMGVKENLFGLYTMAAPAGFILGNFFASRLVHRHSNDAMIRAGIVISFGSAGALIALTFFGLATPVSIMVPLFVYFIGNGLVLPNCLAGALNMVEPSHAGAASAFTGFFQMALSGGVTVILGTLSFHSAMPMALMMTIAAAVSLAVFATMPRGPDPIVAAAD